MTGPLRVRMGVHTGTAEMRDGDYFGTALNRAARLMAVAHGGQVVVSLATEELLRDAVPEECGFVDLGEHRLRDLGRPDRVFQAPYRHDCALTPIPGSALGLVTRVGVVLCACGLGSPVCG